MYSNPIKYRDFVATLKFTSIIALVGVLSCARVMSPPGGPEDKSPPKFISSIPPDNSTGVDPNTNIEVEFDEYLAEISGGVLFLPVVDNTKIKFARKKIIIEQGSPLSEDMTYRLTISNRIKDLRNNNLNRPIQIAFSTGDELDTLSIRGAIFLRDLTPAEQVRINAYIIKGNEIPDSLPENPYAATWSGDDGGYFIGNLPKGNFYLVAIEDNNHDGRYSAGERVALAPSAIESGRKAPWSLVLFQPDTISPDLLMTTAENPYLLRLKFTEPVVTAPRARFSSLPPVGTTEIFIFEDNPNNLGIYSRDGFPSGPISFDITEVFDSSGNSANLQDLDFDFPEFPEDTLPPVPIYRKSRLGNREPLVVDFDKPIKGGQIKVEDSTGARVPGETVVIIPKSLAFIPEPSWPNREDLFYYIDNVQSMEEIGFSDTTGRQIDLIDRVEFGTLLVQSNLPCENPMIEIRQAVNNGKSYYMQKTEEGYITDQLERGDYLVWYFCDNDSDGGWYPGDIQPLKPSEKSFVYPDTLSVKGLWTTEVDLNR